MLIALGFLIAFGFAVIVIDWRKQKAPVVNVNIPKDPDPKFYPPSYNTEELDRLLRRIKMLEKTPEPVAASPEVKPLKEKPKEIIPPKEKIFISGDVNDTLKDLLTNIVSEYLYQDPATRRTDAHKEGVQAAIHSADEYLKSIGLDPTPKK